MKFSVLLPTRNRLEYLRYAVETVRRQDYDDWELVISDNDSEDDIAGFVRSLGDSRVKYVRTASFIPVTENWNNALEHSTGDYFIMLGDDDCLMPAYFSTLHAIITAHHQPDVVYTGAYHYAYPDTMPGAPDGYLQSYNYSELFYDGERPRTEPFVLDPATAQGLVRETMTFRLRFGYNMQFALVSRRMVNELRPHGPFFQSAFPDYYAMNVLFLTAPSIVVCPTPLVVIGVTPKSYGFFHFNLREEEGKDFLKGSLVAATASEKLRRVLLPGTNINNGWLSAAQAIHDHFGAAYKLRVNYNRYRMLQMLYVCEAVLLHRNLPRERLLDMRHYLRPWEKLIYGGALALLLLVRKLLPVTPRKWLTRQLIVLTYYKYLRQYTAREPRTIPGQYRNILEVFERAGASQ